jgi:alkylation response protein AidB-like acyl-CoA dehydrogenase
MPAQPDLQLMTELLSAADGPADISTGWPDGLWSILSDFGTFKWLVPEENGGDGCDRPTLMRRYMAIAHGSLTAAFMLTQHDAALRRLIPAANENQDSPAAFWLREVASGRCTLTVGISQLTTSIRRGERAMAATLLENGGYRLDGSMPWVTGAEQAAAFVTGGTLEDGRQVLVLLPADREGITIDEPEPLAALNASRTTEVRCSNVMIDGAEVLAGPVENVITSRQAGGTGGLETSALALGQARAAIEALRQEDPARFALGGPVATLEQEWAALENDLFAFLSGASSSLTPELIRQRANDLVSRATQACLIARRGSGFLLTDPAQRWARQALFFHVWSCPRPVATASIRGLAGMGELPACGLS